ncbi:MAG: lytic transglycosylase domain-containing protein [Rhodospirillaceae bacterium]|jgi:soluble lytic murein transglycosylase|nr:lytic transglycosylase domain-containing protein [Rhodospirillaceae bacterium]MBT5245862.1 lytic transglycosylase domain-containing protein [Rhodospirillaceae bacterium]MBT5560790.1 lytic transglycosylase domain-containing protein [Rhodospirillaceae bacterium]MBT6240807.1 lytic transglycosylase domain-containing protein [Rhodospirillaceae bacterium]MBT7136930.1 lytic transglycosylase domain-containing protein [Rhodospirillaceae bacterium]
MLYKGADRFWRFDGVIDHLTIQCGWRLPIRTVPFFVLAFLFALTIAPLQAAAIDLDIPEPLNFEDVERYQRIFELQEDGHWKKADKLIKQLDDRMLLGHVLAQRYLHPTKYRSKYKELKDWMASYADHPDARRLYKLALRRKPANWRAPKRPVPGYLGGSAETVRGEQPARKKLSRAQRRQVSAYKRQIRHNLRKGWTKAVKRLIATKDVKRLFSDFDMDEAKARLGAGYFAAGRDEWAIKWAGEAASRSGRFLPEANWTAGLASWRLGRRGQAAGYFEAASMATKTSGWMTSAAAFWAARAYLVGGEPKRVNALLGRAAAYPRTFYGFLGRKMLGLPSTFSWQTPDLEKSALESFVTVPAGRRALGLLQVGESRRAERDLRSLAGRSAPDVAKGILALSARANMPGLAVRLNNTLYPGGGGFDGAAYPLPTWQPEGGYSVDKALIFALIRQESKFNPKAKSWAGARGLMQLMPRTASFVARDRRFHRHDSTRRKLFKPEINIKLGQKYIEMLLGNKKINGDLFLMATAWNGGPGNLNKWRRKTNHMDDPLFFIESIPSRETRIFIERVLTNLWIYRDRLGQPTPSLEAIAAGDWPVYKALDNQPTLLAGN